MLCLISGSQFQSSHPPALHLSYVTLNTSDVCSIRSGHHRLFLHDSSSKRTYSIQSAYNILIHISHIYMFTEVYDVTLVYA